MSWREDSPMDQRLQLVQRLSQRAVYDDRARRAVWRQPQNAEQVGRSFCGRPAERRGVDRPLAATARSPGATDPAVVPALIALRKRHPHWGARKLVVLGTKQHGGARLAESIDGV